MRRYAFEINPWIGQDVLRDIGPRVLQLFNSNFWLHAPRTHFRFRQLCKWVRRPSSHSFRLFCYENLYIYLYPVLRRTEYTWYTLYHTHFYDTNSPEMRLTWINFLSFLWKKKRKRNGGIHSITARRECRSACARCCWVELVNLIHCFLADIDTMFDRRNLSPCLFTRTLTRYTY